MGIKSLGQQMVPWWCFHVMGSATTPCHLPGGPPASPAPAMGKAPLCIRLIRADGRIEVYRRPVSASELMREHPMHLVCRSDTFIIGQRIPALAEGEQLQPGHAYFLLPLHLFQSVLSFVTLASSFARAAAAAACASSSSSSSSSSCSNGSVSPLLLRPFDVHRTPSGKLQIRVCDEFIRRIQEAQEKGAGDGRVGVGSRSEGGGRVCTTSALEKDYRQLVAVWRERQWKPKLETIREYSERKRGKLAAVGEAGRALDGMRRRSKKGHQHQTQVVVEPHGRGDQKQQVFEEKQQKKQQEKQQKKQQQKLQKQEKKQNKQQQKQKKQKQKVVSSNVTKHPKSPLTIQREREREREREKRNE